MEYLGLNYNNITDDSGIQSIIDGLKTNNTLRVLLLHFNQLSINMKLQLDAIQQQTLDVEKQYVVVQEQEREFVKVLNEKYGPGQLDPETGVFTPTK